MVPEIIEKTDGRLLFFTPLLEQRVAKMVYSFHNMGIGVDILCPRSRISSLSFSMLPTTSKIFTYSHIISPQTNMDPLAFFTIIRKLKEIKKKSNIKHIIIRDVFLYYSFLDILKSTFEDAQVFVDIADNFDFEEDYDLSNFKHRKQIRYSLAGMNKLHLAKALMVVCNENKERVVKKYKIPPEKVYVVENMPLLNFLKPVEEEMKVERSLVYSGQLNSEVRDMGTIISALFKTKWSLHLYITNSDSKEYTLLKQKSQERDLRGKIIFHEPVKYASSINVLSQYTMGIIPHKDVNHVRYTLPNKLYDYILAGIPVLANSVPILKKYICQYNVGFTYNSQCELENILETLPLRDLDSYAFSIKEMQSKIDWNKEVAPVLFSMMQGLRI